MFVTVIITDDTGAESPATINLDFLVEAVPYQKRPKDITVLYMNHPVAHTMLIKKPHSEFVAWLNNIARMTAQRV